MLLRQAVLALSMLCVVFTLTTAANPALAPDTWTSIGPTQTSGEVWSVKVDPNNADILYACCSALGLQRSTDGGSTWTALPTGNCVTGFAIDPANSLHMYISYAFTAGGFWESTDGGMNWNQKTVPISSDLGSLSVDPTDFRHVLVSFHYSPDGAASFIESRDGGATWTVHNIPGMGTGTKGLHFLCNPSLGIGNGDTWFITGEGKQPQRTTNAGASWTSIDAGITAPHGADKTTYYTSQGVLYIAGTPSCSRSFDNGVTWQKLTLPDAYYEAVIGDGNTLYTSNAEVPNVPIQTSAQNDGATWTAGTQIFGRGPTDMAYDSRNHIVYGACRKYGVYALKVNDANTGMFISNASTNPGSVFDNASTPVTFSVDVSAQGSVSSVTIDLSGVGGSATAVMTRSTASTYTVSHTVPSGAVAGDLTLVVTAKDNAGHTLYGSINLKVLFHDLPVLVSEGKTVVVSSTQDASVPGSKAVDGNFGSRWASAAGDPQWIYIDLGSVKSVTRVVLSWEAAFASAYKIQISSDASNWVDVFTTTTGNGGLDTTTFAAANARYVRMYGTTRGTNFAYSLYEFQVFSPPPSTANLTGVVSKKFQAGVKCRVIMGGSSLSIRSKAGLFDLRGKNIRKKN